MLIINELCIFRGHLGREKSFGQGNGKGCIPASSTTFASHFLADFRLAFVNPLLAGAHVRESYTRGCMRACVCTLARARKQQASTKTFVHRCPRGHCELFRRSIQFGNAGTGCGERGTGSGWVHRCGTGRGRSVSVSVGVGVGQGTGKKPKFPRVRAKTHTPLRASKSLSGAGPARKIGGITPMLRPSDAKNIPITTH